MSAPDRIDPLLGLPEVEWTATQLDEGQVDPETGETIPRGWYVFAARDGEPEDVYVQLHLEHAVGDDGELITEKVARGLAELLNGTGRP